jgi:ketosteroid isomerase-like protein
MTIALPLLLAAVVSAATPDDDGLPEPLRSLVAAERAFSRHSVAHGIKPAFLEFLGEDGIIFTPLATNGPKWYREQPEPPAPASLSWRPVFADISASGDFGYTTGPYEIRFERDGKTVTSYGHYVTVWRKTSDDRWKVAIDKGIRHPDPSTEKDEVRYPTGPPEPPSVGRLEDVLELDRTYAGPKVFEEIASGRVRLYRDDSFPMLGKEDATRALETGSWTVVPDGGAVAASGDLAYTYGTSRLRSGETSAYLRIWKKEGGAFRLVLDNTTPLPPDYPPPFPREGATRLFENERVVVWDVIWKKGVPTPLHQHRLEVVGVTLVPGIVRSTYPDGTTREGSLEEAGAVTSGGKGLLHREEGVSDVARRAILIELKEGASPPAIEQPKDVPLAWPREGARKVLENDRVIVWDYEFRSGRDMPLHFHDKDTVVVELAPGVLRGYPLEGAPQETTWTGMTARWAPRGRIHREEVVRGNPRVVAVELK